MSETELAQLRKCGAVDCEYKVPNGVKDITQIIGVLNNHILASHPVVQKPRPCHPLPECAAQPDQLPPRRPYCTGTVTSHHGALVFPLQVLVLLVCCHPDLATPPAVESAKSVGVKPAVTSATTKM